MKNSPISRVLTIALGCLVSVPFVMVVTPASALVVSTSFAEAVELHNAGRDGDKAATERAVAAFIALMAEDPSNAEAIAYLGSSYALTARDAGAVVDKIRFTNRGLRFLDQAVAVAPNDFAVRMIRGSVTASLPAMFGRTDSAVEDFMMLDQMFSAAQAPTMAPAMIGVYTQLAELAPDQADWDAKLAGARAMVAGQ